MVTTFIGLHNKVFLMEIYVLLHLRYSWQSRTLH